ncbi:hypothetical protein RKD05_001555 [Microbacterium sp. SLBN-111]
MSTRAPASTPCVGSSARSTRGRASSVRASTTFCWLPPDSDDTAVRGLGVLIDRRPIISFARAIIFRSLTKPAVEASGRVPAETFSATDSGRNTPSRCRSAGT